MTPSFCSALANFALVFHRLVAGTGWIHRPEPYGHQRDATPKEIWGPGTEVGLFDMRSDSVEICLGEEWDAQLIQCLLDTMENRMHGIPLGPQLWAVVGQEFHAWNFALGDEILHVQAVTWEGLTISGPKVLVELVERSVRKRSTIRAAEASIFL